MKINRIVELAAKYSKPVASKLAEKGKDILVKNGGKLIAAGAAATSSIAIAGIAINKAKQKDEPTIKNGFATTQDGKPFTGEIKKNDWRKRNYA